MLSKTPRNQVQKRRNCDSIPLPIELRRQICTVLNHKYQYNGQFNMRRFLNYWEQKFHSKPPTAQTIRNLRSRHTQQNFEYWLIDGCCRLLLDCSYEEWEKQYLDRTSGNSDCAMHSASDCAEAQLRDRQVLKFPCPHELDPSRILPDRELIKAIEAIANDVHQIDLLYTDLQQKFKFLSAILHTKVNLAEVKSKII
jgi:hypothetical protein